MVSSQDKQRKQKTLKRDCPQNTAVNPHGPEEVQSLKVAQTTRDVHEVRHEGLMEQVVQRDNHKKALRRVEQNKGAPGIDGVTVESYRTILHETWEKTKVELLNGTYKPQPVRRFEIPKPDGGVRLIGIPTVQDRLIQQAILQVLTPIFDPTFLQQSYGFRPGCNTHQAVKRAQDYIKQGYVYVVDMDLEKFFDRVNHDILMSKLSKGIGDKRMLKLIRNYLQAGVMINGCHVVTEEGTPQGGPLSPLLSNIMLHELDVELTRRGHRFVRYADDCNIYVKSKRAGERVLESVKKYVETRLKLKVNEAKSAVDRPEKRKILGFSFMCFKEVKISVAPKAIDRFKSKIRELTRRSACQPIEKRIEIINRFLIGWFGHFRLAQTRSVFEKLDGWLRRRLRACLLKQWKEPKTKRRNLIALGLPEIQAAQISSSGKGCWRLAKTYQINRTLGNVYWKNLGLFSLAARYDELRASA